MPNPDGSRDELRFEVLRSPMWMEEVGAKPGAAIWFEFAEMGVAGLATVDAVKPCPSIAPGPGRVVLATMTHLNGFVRRLHFAGTDETLQPTATHQIYSEDRQDWVPAGELRPGETLRTQGGQARLTQIERVPGVHRVFNIEVEAEHWYFVGAHRVLSHNSCAQPDPAPKSGETVATKRGRQEHKDWDPGEGFEKEVTLPSGKRVDAVNFEQKHVKELKPNNPRAVKRGEKQVEPYRKELQEEHKGDWTSSVETYD